MRDFPSDSNFRVQNLKIPHFLCAFAGVETSIPARRDSEKCRTWYSIPPNVSACVCVCVFASGRLECNSSDEVTCWSLFKHCPPDPWPPSIKHVSAPPTTDEVVTITGTHHISPLTIITNDSNDLTLCFRWPPPNPCHDTGGGLPALLFLCVWLCSQQPHLLRVNTTLGTISPPLAKLLLTLFNWGLIACQQDVALAESLTQLLLILMIHPSLNHQE